MGQEGSAVLDQEPLLYKLRPTKAQICAASLVATLSLAGFFAAFPFRHLPLAKMTSFIPVVDTALFLGDLVIATLLLAEASILRSKALLALGTGYFFTCIIVIPHALTFPGVFSPSGLLGASLSTTAWLYFFWHCGLPAAVIAYACLKNAPDWPYTAPLSPLSAIAISLILATILVVALTLLATAGESLLPQLMENSIQGYAKKILEPAIPVMALTAAAMALTWYRRSSVLDLWLLLILWVWLLELLSSTITPHRFDLGWYAGKLIGLLPGLFVLLMLLSHTCRLYARNTLQFKARQWERENRLVMRDAIAASIAHELRQPIGAISMNAQAALRHTPKPDDFTSSVLNDIVSDTVRANDIVASTREIFGEAPSHKSLTDMNQLLRDTLGLISRELRNQGVTVNLQLADSLKPIAVNRLQTQQAFYNLFMNAAEAMSKVTDRPRMLTIRSSSDEKGMRIDVQDTGTGITAVDRERIFEIFYTTKEHGTGLGLSICRSVVAALGGRLDVADRVSTGARFEIYLPYGHGAEKAA